MKENLIQIGYVTKAFGIKGALCVKLFNEGSECMVVGQKFHAQLGTRPLFTLTLESVIPGGRFKFEEVFDRTEAEKLKSAKIFIDRADLPEISREEVYLNDLVGAQVFDLENNCLGEVIGFSHNNAQTLIEIKKSTDQKNASIPFVKPIVQEVDEDNKKIIVDLPLGLLDL